MTLPTHHAEIPDGPEITEDNWADHLPQQPEPLPEDTPPGEAADPTDDDISDEDLADLDDFDDEADQDEEPDDVEQASDGEEHTPEHAAPAE